MIVQDLVRKNLISPPRWLPDNMVYLVVSGSTLYGMNDESSDQDLVGITIPPKDMIFPHLAGEIQGFGKKHDRFENWLKHGVVDGDKEYDLNIFSIVRWFHLAMENNPNTLEILFAPQNYVLCCTQIGQLIRENRKLFIHKGLRHKYARYAFAQRNRAKSQDKTGKRKEIVDKYGYDIKSAAHCIRLLSQGIQLLAEGDLDIQREAEMLKDIKRGEWSWEQVCSYFDQKEQQLEGLYTDSKLPYKPDEEQIKALLLECLNLHYHYTDSSCVVIKNKAEVALAEIKKIVEGV